jgi:hypothetical protein
MTTDQELLAAKREVEARFLGKHGIHGCGVSQKLGIIRIYTDEPQLLTQAVVDDIRQLAAPWEVEVVTEGSPKRNN